ncbi:MAG: hypothetical protein O3C21_15605 [Verrucomicrobia bacterium]|nr:hypothetical protein [Verrucomicrobiota bacterium]
MPESKLSWLFLGTALLAVAWGAWLKFHEPKPAEQEVEWVVRKGKLVERESSEPFQGTRRIPFERSEDMIQWEFEYVDGIRQGAATEFFAGPTPRVKSRATYVDGKREGPVITYHGNGVRASACNAVDGLLEGLMTFYNSDGTIRERQVYEKSLPNGIAAITIDPVLTPEPDRVYDDFENPEPDVPEPLALLDPEGKPFTGKQFGTFFGGAKAFVHEYSDGFEDGMHQGWNPAGEPEYERPYLDGKKHGRWKIWGAGGRLLSDQAFNHGRQIGSSKTWFPNGQLREESQFVHGAEHGERTNFDPQGKKRRVMTFDHGIQTHLIEWDRSGDDPIQDEASEMNRGAALAIEASDEALTRSVPIADLPADFEGEVTVRFRYRLSTSEEVPAAAAREFKVSLLHDGAAREFTELEGEIGGWRSSQWLATVEAGETLTLQVEAQPGSLQIDLDGIGHTAAAEPAER